MPGLIQEMEKLQWKLHDGMAAKKFYKKEINEQEIKISIRPKEQGGPKEENATTLVIVELEK